VAVRTAVLEGDDRAAGRRYMTSRSPSMVRANRPSSISFDQAATYQLLKR
jgi:hypothetical protein